MLTYRHAEERDRQTILDISAGVEVFTREEVETVDELLECFLHQPGQEDYLFFVACEDDQVLGFICVGPTSLTDRTYDLYWIAVGKQQHNKGVGRKLLGYTEDYLRDQGVRLIVLETSGTAPYEPTRAFYERVGYDGHLAARDFYKDGDDLWIYTKHLQRQESCH